MNPVSAVVTPLDEHMGLDIARSLGSKGIPVFGMDPNPEAVGRLSKYCKLVVCPDWHRSEEDYVQHLLEWGKRQSHKPVLFALSDDTALICSRERERLAECYEYVMPGHHVMAAISAKAGLAEAADNLGIAGPRTVCVQTPDHIDAIAETVKYPVVLKPVESVYWHRTEIASLLRENALSGRAKVVFCSNRDELVAWYSRVAKHDPRMIVQEVIPGPDENLVYISFYLNRNSEPLALFAGRKLRVIPAGFGSASFVRSHRDPEVEALALRFLSKLGYRGLGGIEFKKDPRDGIYKLIEFNTRFGMWDGLGVRCGVDTPYIAYRDALGLETEPQLKYREGVIWVDLQRDVRAFRIYRRQGKLGWGEWLRSLRGEKMWAVYSMGDWRPGLAFTFQLMSMYRDRLKAARGSAKDDRAH